MLQHDRQYPSCLILALLFIVGCSPMSTHTVSESAQTDLGDLEEGPIDLNKPIVFSDQISKIFHRHCTGCHQGNGGIAPFPLTSYQHLSGFKQMIQSSLTQRRMPPPGVDNSGSCQEFSNANYLSSEQIAAVNSWYEAGMPRGNPNISTIPAARLRDLSEPKSVLRMPEVYTPKPDPGKIDDYRCFVLDPKKNEDDLITAIQVLPDKVAQVHHVIVFKPTSEKAQAEAEKMSGADGRPGYPCFGAAGVPSTVVGLWAPGGNAEEMRDADSGRLVGLPLEKGRKLIMQVHYNTQNGVFADQSSIAVKYDKSAIRARWMVRVNFILSLKPGLADVVQSETFSNVWTQTVNEIYERGLADDYINGGGILSTLSPELIALLLNQPDAKDFKVYGVAPHMHTLGTKIKVEKISSSNQNTCLADVPKFDFHWQGGYNYVRPQTISKTDKVKLTCHFNTTGRTETVRFGEGTDDEMCLAFLLVADQ